MEEEVWKPKDDDVVLTLISVWESLVFPQARHQRSSAKVPPLL